VLNINKFDRGLIRSDQENARFGALFEGNRPQPITSKPQRPRRLQTSFSRRFIVFETGPGRVGVAQIVDVHRAALARAENCCFCGSGCEHPSGVWTVELSDLVAWKEPRRAVHGTHIVPRHLLVWP
jgi:hypothetical protein